MVNVESMSKWELEKYVEQMKEYEWRSKSESEKEEIKRAIARTGLYLASYMKY